MNRPMIVAMYLIGGVVAGYFSIYFLIEMKREYGDKFTRPRNRVSKIIIPNRSIDTSCFNFDWSILYAESLFLWMVWAS